MASFFNVGGNPFSTPVGQRIEQATDVSLASENWALNMEICDLVNESPESARDAMKAIRKRLTQNAGKNYTVIMYTLTVLETCVKNCGRPFHLLVSNKEFIQELVKLIGPKNDPPAVVQEKVLSLIQIWADAFRKQQDMNGVVQVYQELKNKGIEFPMTDLDSLAPIFTPQRSVPESKASPALNVVPMSSPQHAVLAPGSPAVTTTGGVGVGGGGGVVVGAGGTAATTVPATLTPEQVAKLQSELDVVSLNMSIFGEMLTELKPGHEAPNDYKLLAELASTCKEMQGRIVELVGKINHDEYIAELLRLNDELNNLFLRHARYENNRDPKSVAAPSAILGAALGIPANEKSTAESQKDSLIDLSDEHPDVLPKQMAGMGLASSQLSQINSVSAQSGSGQPKDKDYDEFDILAKSRKMGDPIKGGKDSHEVNPDGLGMATQNRSQPTTRENEFDEIAAWLESNPEDDIVNPEESVTSKEFERFLAERAAVADTLPTITSQTGSTNSSGTPRHKKQKDEEGSLQPL